MTGREHLPRSGESLQRRTDLRVAARLIAASDVQQGEEPSGVGDMELRECRRQTPQPRARRPSLAPLPQQDAEVGAVHHAVAVEVRRRSEGSAGMSTFATQIRTDRGGRSTGAGEGALRPRRAAQSD